MNVLVVFDHPRRTSFCGSVLDAYVRGLDDAGHDVEIADLHAEGFDPRMIHEDEPNWSDPRKIYSAAVRAEHARIERVDALAFVFPVWWWSLPAMTKGGIDRVLSNGWAYGAQKLPVRKARLLAVAASGAEDYAKRGYDSAMQTQLLTGIIDYCGITDNALDFLHGSLSSDESRAALLKRAFQLGRSFG